MVTAPADALQLLIRPRRSLPSSWFRWGFCRQQGNRVSFVANGIQFPTSSRLSRYNALIGPLAAWHQAFNQAWTAAVNATR